MSRVLSARDVLKALPHYKNEFDVIEKSNDAEVYGVLTAVGFDVSKGISYDVALHRDMSNVVAVGFMLSGDYSLDPKYRKFLDLTDKIVVNGMSDPSFARELEEIRGKRFQYFNEEELEQKVKTPKDDLRYYSEEELKEMGYTGGDEEDVYEGEVTDNFEVLSSQIDTMKALLKIAREA